MSSFQSGWCCGNCAEHATASGMVDRTDYHTDVISLEEEHYRRIARESPELIVRGILERTEEGVVNLLADRFEALGVSAAQRSRDFR